MYNRYPLDYDYLGKSASDMDCTGLIPSGPVEEEDLLDYQDLYQFGGHQMTDTIREDIQVSHTPFKPLKKSYNEMHLH